MSCACPRGVGPDGAVSGVVQDSEWVGVGGPGSADVELVSTRSASVLFVTMLAVRGFSGALVLSFCVELVLDRPAGESA